VLVRCREEAVGETSHRGHKLVSGQPVQVMRDLRIQPLLGKGLCSHGTGGHGGTVRVTSPG